jgi:hypothetical protein
MKYSKLNWLVNMSDFAVNFGFEKSKLLRHYNSLNVPYDILNNLDKRVEDFVSTVVEELSKRDLEE